MNTHILLTIGSLVHRAQDHVYEEAAFASLPEPDFNLSTARIAFLIVTPIGYLADERPDEPDEVSRRGMGEVKFFLREGCIASFF